MAESSDLGGVYCVLAVIGIICFLTYLFLVVKGEEKEDRRRPGGPRRPPGRKKSRTRPLLHRGHQVRPGDIWWAPFTFAEGTGYKVRPCLVLRVCGDRVRVAKITGTNLDGYRDCRRIVVPGYRRTSWVDYRQQRWLHVSELRNRCVDR